MPSNCEIFTIFSLKNKWKKKPLLYGEQLCHVCLLLVCLFFCQQKYKQLKVIEKTRVFRHNHSMWNSTAFSEKCSERRSQLQCINAKYQYFQRRIYSYYISIHNMWAVQEGFAKTHVNQWKNWRKFKCRRGMAYPPPPPREKSHPTTTPSRMAEHWHQNWLTSKAESILNELFLVSWWQNIPIQNDVLIECKCVMYCDDTTILVNATDPVSLT